MKTKPSKKTIALDAEWKFDQIDRTLPLRDQIYSMIRSMILTGALPPGGSLEEKVIAARLGVSRTPVREAVQRLGDEQLIEIKPQSGTRVAYILQTQVHQAFIIRRALESETVEAAANNITPEDATRLEGNYLQHELAINRGQFVDAIKLDDEFHQTIARIANLPLLWRAITIFKAQLDRCRHQTVSRQGRGQMTLQQHKAVLDALKDGDAKSARKAMQNHLDETYKDIQAFLEMGKENNTAESSHRSSP
ncbi:MAG: GntR family transcriptional regulator [Pseudomonadota bacterium]